MNQGSTLKQTLSATITTASVLQPTPEQEAIIAFAKNSSESMVINALAGAAKTTTLTMLAAVLPEPASTLAVAFNSRIKEELEKKMPQAMTVLTFNGLGHRAWGRHLRKQLTLDTKKNFSILQSQIKQTGIEVSRDEFTQFLDLISSAKTSGLVPAENKMGASPLLPDCFESWQRLCVECDLPANHSVINLAKACLTESIRQAYQGIIDFDDQLYMSVCFNAPYPKFKTILVDEAQDLSAMNHKQVLKCCEILGTTKTRLFICGDVHQSIYAFRGADSDSIPTLAKTFSAVPFELNTTFRCDRAICDQVRKHVPKIQPRASAGAGLVSHLKEWNVREFAQGSAILCRNNAPLFRVASKALRAGIGCQILGREIGKGLTRVLKKFGATLRDQELRTTIMNWASLELQSASSSNNTAKLRRIEDKQECLLALSEANPEATCEQLILIIEKLFADKSAILTFATGHKAKGLEWPVVYHLDSWIIAKNKARLTENNQNSQLVQECNLEYVINTRAKHELHFIRSEKEETPDA